MLAVVGADAEPPQSQARAIVVSGGVSLGAYQAGFLYLYTEAMKRSGRARIPLLTGASAGSANGFLAGLSMCQPPTPDPHDSLGWRTWIPVGFDDLYDPDHVRPDGLFSRGPLAVATHRIWRELESGLPDTCDFVLGVSTTRLQIHNIRLQEGLRIPRQEEKFLVRVRGRGLGVPPEFSNYADPYRDVEQPILPFEASDDPRAVRRDFERFRTLMFASMAFPIAFPPQWVSYCMTSPPPSGDYEPYRELTCVRPERADLFVDGGVLDNSPLRLAVQVAETGLRTDGLGQPVWRDLSISGWTDRRTRYTELDYVYLDPSLTVFPLEEPVRERSRKGDGLYVASTLFSNFVAAARAKELYTLAEERDQLADRMSLSFRYYPSAGDPLYAFMGFFERDFREFDFYLGMYDAWRFLGADPSDIPVSIEPSVPEGWERFACLLGWLDGGDARFRSACAGPELRNFRILLQTSLDRLWDHCSAFGDVTPLTRHSGCTMASAGEPRPWLLPGPRAPDSGRRPGEWHFRYAMRRLATYGFEFRDLGLTARQANRASAAIRSRLLSAMETYARTQSGQVNRVVVESGGRILANQLAYEAPTVQWGLLIGTALEATGLWAPVDRWRGWFRLQAGVLARGWTSPLAPGPSYLALGLLAGPEFLVPPFTNSWIQTAVGVRAGYQWSTEDRAGARDCLPQPNQDDPRLCSQAVVQPFIALGALDRLRLLVGLDVFPEDFSRARGSGGEAEFIRAPIGLEFGLGLLFY
jgi:hypothetical protein